jgi:hypothetical protein
MNLYDDEELEKKEDEEIEIGEEDDDGEIVEEVFDDIDKI